MIGFSFYNQPPQVGPTTQEILAALTAVQKTGILNGFALKTPVTQLKHEIGVHSFAIRHLYGKIDEMEERARFLMRSDIPPATSTALVNQIKGDFVEDFTGPQVTAILLKMVKYSKFAGDGDWNFYANSVIL